MLDILNKNYRLIRIVLAVGIAFCSGIASLWIFALIPNFLLVTLMGVLEFYEYRKSSLPLRQKVASYIRDMKSWSYGDHKKLAEYYNPNPMFTITAVTDEDERKDFDNLAYDLEWNRGEIGASNEIGNGAFLRKILFGTSVIDYIHIVEFDNGKKTIVAPDWEAIGEGRFYYYLKDSVEYAYQCLLANEYREDHSKGLMKKREAGYFDIPVLKSETELNEFVQYCDMGDTSSPETDKEEQNRIFYRLLEKYAEFKNRK